ncbi:MAG: CHASE4 domain-containing protein, partial [Thermodesulfobacteriota bacterium]
MDMKIQTKILLLLSLVIGAFMVGLGCLRHWEVKGMESLFQVEKREKEEFFDKSIKLKGESLETLAFDYTYWDEMVDFLKTRDKTWASEILDTSLSSYKADAMWVYTTDGTLVYSVRKSKDEYIKNEEIPLPEASLGEVLGQKRFNHFFLNTAQGLMEVHGATIHPSNNVERKTPPRGYFFVGRSWNTDYMTELAGLTKSSLMITPVEETETSKEGAD